MCYQDITSALFDDKLPTVEGNDTRTAERGEEELCRPHELATEGEPLLIAHPAWMEIQDSGLWIIIFLLTLLSVIHKHNKQLPGTQDRICWLCNVYEMFTKK